MKRFDAKTFLMLSLPVIVIVFVGVFQSTFGAKTEMSIVTNEMTRLPILVSDMNLQARAKNSLTHHVVVEYPTPPFSGRIPFVPLKHLNCDIYLKDATGKVMGQVNSVSINGLGRLESASLYDEADLSSAKNPFTLNIRVQSDAKKPATHLSPKKWIYTPQPK